MKKINLFNDSTTYTTKLQPVNLSYKPLHHHHHHKSSFQKQSTTNKSKVIINSFHYKSKQLKRQQDIQSVKDLDHFLT